MIDNLDKRRYAFYDYYMKLILASGSPRRKRMLNQLGLKFEVKKAPIREIDLNTPMETCIFNATQKVKWVANNSKITNNSTILGFDTIVWINDTILGKPANEVESRKMLQSLSGTWHEVYSGVTLWQTNGIINDFESTRVKFHSLADNQIEYYIKSGNTLDKAGSYGIQDEDMSFIDRIEGSFSNVVGVPISITRKMLKDVGFVI